MRRIALLPEWEELYADLVHRVQDEMGRQRRVEPAEQWQLLYIRRKGGTED